MKNKTWPPAPQTGTPTPVPPKDETDYQDLLEKYMFHVITWHGESFLTDVHRLSSKQEPHSLSDREWEKLEAISNKWTEEITAQNSAL